MSMVEAIPMARPTILIVENPLLRQRLRMVILKKFCSMVMGRSKKMPDSQFIVNQFIMSCLSLRLSVFDTSGVQLWGFGKCKFIMRNMCVEGYHHLLSVGGDDGQIGLLTRKLPDRL